MLLLEELERHGQATAVDESCDKFPPPPLPGQCSRQAFQEPKGSNSRECHPHLSIKIISLGLFVKCRMNNLSLEGSDASTLNCQYPQLFDAGIENCQGEAQCYPRRALHFAFGLVFQNVGLKRPLQYEAGRGLTALAIAIVFGASGSGINIGISIFILPENRAEPQ